MSNQERFTMKDQSSTQKVASLGYEELRTFAASYDARTVAASYVRLCPRERDRVFNFVQEAEFREADPLQEANYRALESLP